MYFKNKLFVTVGIGLFMNLSRMIVLIRAIMNRIKHFFCYNIHEFDNYRCNSDGYVVFNDVSSVKNKAFPVVKYNINKTDAASY